MLYLPFSLHSNIARLEQRAIIDKRIRDGLLRCTW